MIDTYNLSLYQQLNNKLIGSIIYMYDDEDKEILVANIEILDEYKNKGYGKLLLLCMFLDLLSKNIFYIRLDDCSDYSCSSKSIYNKFGFKQTEAKDEEMYIFFENNINEDKNITIQPYRNIEPYRNIKDLIEKNKQNMNLDESYFKNFSELFAITKIKNNSKERNITKNIISKIQNYVITKNIHYGGDEKSYKITDINIYKYGRFLNIYNNNNKLYIKNKNEFELL